MKRILFITMLLACTMLTACNNTNNEIILNENIQSENKVIQYSNLTDESVCNELRNIFLNAGISAARQDNFFKHVEQFNSSVSTDSLAGEFVELTSTMPVYDPYAMQDEWNEKNPTFMGYNCRITALSLFGDFIDIPSGESFDDEIIVFDLAALDSDSSALNENDLEGFKQLYSTIDTKKSVDPVVHAEVLSNEWKNKGIKFKENDKVSLISVVLHEAWDEESYLFIGHTGLLFPVEDELYFVEKLAFQEPYQLTKFSSRKELNDYLMEKYNLNEGMGMAPTFIMENDKLMDVTR